MTQILSKRSSTADKRPDPANLSNGELAVNFNSTSGNVFYKNSAGGLNVVGAASVSACAPNSTPAGFCGNSPGEFWFDSTSSALKIWNGTTWFGISSGSSAGTVTSIVAGAGLAGGTITTSGTIALSTTGVTAGSYTYACVAIDCYGRITSASCGSSPVTSVTGTSPISVNNTVPTQPVISVDTASTTALGVTQLLDSVSSSSTSCAATPAAVKCAYDLANLALPKAGGTMTGNIAFNAGQAFPVVGIQDGTADQKGVVQVGTNISVTSGVISVASASTSALGVVQLNDTTTSTSTDLALTAAQGKSLQDQIDALAVSSNIILGGTFNANTGLVDSVTTLGSAGGLVVGSALPTPSGLNDEIFVIVDVQGSSGPSGTPPYHVGDWFLSNGTTWQFLNVGYAPGQATTTSQGVVQLATDAEVQAGTDSSNAVVSSALQSKISDSISTASSTAIASSTAVKCAYDIASCALPKAGGTMTGNVLMRTSGNLVPSCVVFCDYLGSCTISGITSSCICDSTTLAASALALCEVYATAGSALPKAGGAVTGTICFTGVTGTGCLQGITDLWQPVTGYCCSNWALSTCGARTLYCCVIGSSLQTTGGTISGGVTFEAGSAGICFLGSTSRLVGVTDSFTTTCATLAASATAVKCAYNVAVAAVPGSCYSSKGGLVVGTGISTYTPLAVGTNGQVLVADSACPNGMKWGTGGGSGTVTSITAGTGLTGGTITTSGTVALDTACVVQPTAYTAKGTILSASAASTPTALAVGGNGCTLVANSACTTGLCWGPGAIPCSTITAKGDLIAGTDPGTSSALPVGANGLFLTANSASATGLCWAQVGDSPVGAIAFFAMNTAPTGWLIADGSCVSRATYSGLFAAVGTTYGAGDGSTTFQLPNLRGRFLRGWNSTATGCDPSRAFGSCQAQALCCHNHGITMCPGTAGVPEWAIKDDTSLTRGYPSCGGSATPSNKQRGFSDCVGGSATETRPDNIALLPCIKVGISVALDVNATPTVAGAVTGCTNNLCHNTMLGCSAGAGISATTCALTAIGKQALTVATGNNNTAIGTYAGCTLTTGANNTLVGFNAAPSTVTVSNEITLGNSSVATIRAQVTTITSLSDGRDKTCIRDIPVGLNFLNSIRPVEFEWRMRDGGKVGEIDTGFIAQDLQDVQEEIGYTLPGLVYEANPDRLEAGYGKLLPVLVRAIQELSEENREIKRRLAELGG